MRELARLAIYDIELVEDPVASLEELAALRGRAGMPVAAETSIRTTADARRLRRLEAADAVVLKPQRIGGVREALRAAEESGRSGDRVECAGNIGRARGCGGGGGIRSRTRRSRTARALRHCLNRNVVDHPLIPVDGWLAPCRPTVNLQLLAGT